MRADGSTAVVVAVLSVPGAAEMWDLTVSDLHDFAVGDGQFVVHNCENPLQRAHECAHELQDALPDAQKGRVTMAVGITDDGRTIIGTSEEGGYLRRGVREAIQEGEIIADGPGHAEVNVIDKAKQMGSRLVAIGAGRPICEECERVIVDELGRDTIASPTRSGFTPL